jgi:hypothetical protein
MSKSSSKQRLEVLQGWLAFMKAELIRKNRRK